MCVELIYEFLNINSQIQDYQQQKQQQHHHKECIDLILLHGELVTRTQTHIFQHSYTS